MDVSKVPIPPMMAARPKDRRGFPIPYFQFIPSTFEQDGKIDFRVTDPIKRMECLQKRLCGLCGQPLLNAFYFIGGPLSTETKVYTDPPLHGNCARFAMKVCPFLANPDYNVVKRYPKGDTGVTVVSDAMAAVDRPPQMHLVKATKFELTRVKDGRTGKIHPMVYAYAIDGQVVEVF